MKLKFSKQINIIFIIFINTTNNYPSYKKIIIQDTNNLCKDYLKSIQWTFEYYFNECSNWKWYYPYHFALFLKIYHLILKYQFTWRHY